MIRKNEKVIESNQREITTEKTLIEKLKKKPITFYARNEKCAKCKKPLT